MRCWPDEIERMYDAWPKRNARPSPRLAADADYRSFSDRDELMWAYNRWLG